MSKLLKLIFDNFKVKSGWAKWYHYGIPDQIGKEREEARNFAEINKHCAICTVLSGCYFQRQNMPMFPRHIHCDCMLFSIKKPVGNAQAECALEKFTEYIFSEKYSDNGKIKLFSDLGFSIEDAVYLKSEYERQAISKYINGEFNLGTLNRFGQRITIAIKLKSAVKDDIIIKSGWMVRPSGLITCNTPLGG